MFLQQLPGNSHRLPLGVGCSGHDTSHNHGKHAALRIPKQQGRCAFKAAASMAAAAGAMAAVSRGALICFEGADRCGKTTQCAKLVEALRQRGVPVEMMTCPDRANTHTGPCINAYLRGDIELDDAAVHLLFSANRWERRDHILSALLSGTSVVFDRYAYSGVAYTVAKQKQHLDMAWCQAPEAGLPAPDAVLYMHLPPGAAAARAGFGGERYEQEAFQLKVVQTFDAFKQDSNWVQLDGTGSVQEVHKKVLQVTEPVILQCQQGASIGVLWG